jgi:carbonic anhydrase/acetyltransferase-like protein (isoleucine patch superfamily)
VTRKLRALGLLLTALLPGPFKRTAYRWWWGYTIGRGVWIGLAYLDCRKLAIADRVRIGHGVLFVRCGDVHIGAHACIGPLNVFRGGTRIDLGDYCQVLRQNVINAIPDHDCVGSPDSSFSLGYGAVVTAEHRIDFTDRVEIGRCSMLAGRNSSIWTHNRKRAQRVTIGDYTYLGSEIRVAPGASVADCCMVGIGSIVAANFTEPFTLISGSPARLVRRLTPADGDVLFTKTRNDLPDETYPPWPVHPRTASGS